MVTDEISKLIHDQFDTRCEVMVATYIMDKGYSYVKYIEDKAIEGLEGNGIMTKRFVQELVRTARDICVKYKLADIMTWIRLECFFDPFPQTVTLTKEDFADESVWEWFCQEIDYNEDADTVELSVIPKGVN